MSIVMRGASVALLVAAPLLGTSQQTPAVWPKPGQLVSEGLALHDVYSRLARTLSELSLEQDGKYVLQQRLTHQDLANMVGASREMITRILRDLTVGGYISVENREITLLKKLPSSW